MNRDSKLSAVLHLLLHMAEDEAPKTSEELARMMGGNPVVVRRTLAGLREAGLVRSEKGRGGGWALTCDLHAVTLFDVYEALARPPLFAIGNRNASPQCLVEQAVNAALDDALGQAERILLASFADVTLAALSADFHRRFDAKRSSKGQ